MRSSIIAFIILIFTESSAHATDEIINEVEDLPIAITQERVDFWLNKLGGAKGKETAEILVEERQGIEPVSILSSLNHMNVNNGKVVTMSKDLKEEAGIIGTYDTANKMEDSIETTELDEKLMDDKMKIDMKYSVEETSVSELIDESNTYQFSVNYPGVNSPTGYHATTTAGIESLAAIKGVKELKYNMENSAMSKDLKEEAGIIGTYDAVNKMEDSIETTELDEKLMDDKMKIDMKYSVEETSVSELIDESNTYQFSVNYPGVNSPTGYHATTTAGIEALGAIKGVEALKYNMDNSVTVTTELATTNPMSNTIIGLETIDFAADIPVSQENVLYNGALRYLNIVFSTTIALLGGRGRPMNQMLLLTTFIINTVSQYDEAICTGGAICRTRADRVKCYTDWDLDSAATPVVDEKYYESGTGHLVQHMRDVAISPIDGTIYVIYATGSAVDNKWVVSADKLGIMQDPLTNTPPYEITKVSELKQDHYTGMTFDSSANLYAVTNAGNVGIYSIDYSGGSDPIDTLIDDTIDRACSGEVCIETLFYNFETQIFYRISAKWDIVDQFYSRSTINGPDSVAVAMSYQSPCQSSGQTIGGAFYIGSETSIIGCGGAREKYLATLTDTPAGVTINAIGKEPREIHPITEAIWSYNKDGSICKAPVPTYEPTTNTNVPTASTATPTGKTNVPTASTATPTGKTNVPTASTATPTAKTNVPTASTGAPITTPTTDDDNDDDDSDSDSSGSSEMAALMEQNQLDNNNNRPMSKMVVINLHLSEKSIFNLWILFGLFSVVSIIACWFYYK
eukprot:499804_1